MAPQPTSAACATSPSLAVVAVLEVVAVARPLVLALALLRQCTALPMRLINVSATVVRAFPWGVAD